MKTICFALSFRLNRLNKLQIVKNKITFLAMIIFINAYSQIINEAPYILTIDQLKNWTATGEYASPDLIIEESLADRFVNTQTQMNSALNNDMKIAYLPDGMNNFGNYFGEQSQFNLYNFTNWAYIDKLIWFGGTADQTVQLPSSPWGNAAHRNGVKVFGDIYFSLNQFGGSNETVLSFLEQDNDNNFIVIPKLVEIMEYYHFDGWFINMETNTNPTTGALMYEFIKELTQQVESQGKEVMWYDSMVLNGNIEYQNYLSSENVVFFQNNEDNSPITGINGYEQRVSSNLFINFFWYASQNPSALTELSRDNAQFTGRSPYEIFTGVDLVPGRNQSPFETGGNTWMSQLHNSNSPFTSLGLFATNIFYDQSQYSNFKNNPNDYENFYSAERHFFAGADQNATLEDVSGFKGVSNWVPAASVITSLFQTNFNTGHGLGKFSQGNQISTEPWHHINEQDILPTWQFAFSNENLSAKWDFEMAYEGGNSLKIEGDIFANSPVNMSLYKTNIEISNDTSIAITYYQNNDEAENVSLVLTFEGGTSNEEILPLDADGETGWITNAYALSDFQGATLVKIGLQFSSTTTQNNYTMNFGSLSLSNSLSIQPISHKNNSSLSVLNSSSGELKLNFENFPLGNTQLYVYDFQGRLIESKTIKVNAVSITKKLHLEASLQGNYILQVINAKGEKVSKKIQIK